MKTFTVAILAAVIGCYANYAAATSAPHIDDEEESRHLLRGVGSDPEIFAENARDYLATCTSHWPLVSVNVYGVLLLL